MKIVYSLRAIRDLERIASYYRTVASADVASAMADRIESVINRLAEQPHSAPRVARRANVRAVVVLRYPYRIFYRLRADAVEVLHIRHTAQRPWNEAGGV
jgi:toxin ParE1/3/4